MKRRWQYLQTNSTVHLARIFCRRPNSLPCPSVSIGIIANILINSHRSFSWSTLCLLSLYLLSRGPANASSHSLHTGYRPITASLSLLSRQGARFLFFPLRASSLLLGPSLTMLSLSLSLSFFLRVALLLLRKSSPDRLTPAKWDHFACTFLRERAFSLSLSLIFSFFLLIFFFSLARFFFSSSCLPAGNKGAMIFGSIPGDASARSRLGSGD